MAERWVVCFEIAKGADGKPCGVVYTSGLGPERVPPRPPAGGRAMRSGDGNWLTIYRKGTKDETALVPILVLMRIAAPFG